MKQTILHYFKQVGGIKDNPPALVLSIAILTLSILGARLQIPNLTMAMIVLICVVMGLSVFNKIKHNSFPVVIYVVALALLFQTTLLSNGLVGTDIHSEYYFAHLTERTGFWDYTISHAFNSAIASVYLIPMIAKFTGISVLWIFKIGSPIMFAFVPLLLYYIFKSQFKEKNAFLGCMFFLIIPPYAIEMASLPRQQISELMFVLALFLIIVSKLNLKVKLPIIITLALLSTIFHYSLFLIIVAYFGAGLITLLAFKNRTFPIKYMAIIMVAVMATGFVYFGNVASGVPLKSMAWLGQSQISRVITMAQGATDKPLVPLPSNELLIPSSTPPEVTESQMPKPLLRPPASFKDHSPLMKTALGLDMDKASDSGKTFRVFQITTQILLVVGTVQLLRKRRKYKPEYFAFCIGSLAILGLCFGLPGFSAILNASRFYHIALIMLAPVAVIGGLTIFRNHKALVLAVFIPYFLFSSGFVFEVTKSESINSFDTPFTTPLSYQRLDLAGVYSDNDIEVAKWAYEHKLLPIYGDLYGELLLEEYFGVEGWGKGMAYIPHPYLDYDITFKFEETKMESESYVFMRERNTETQAVTFWNGVGLRATYPFERFDMEEDLESRPIIFQRGNAVIYGESK